MSVAIGFSPDFTHFLTNDFVSPKYISYTKTDPKESSFQKDLVDKDEIMSPLHTFFSLDSKFMIIPMDNNTTQIFRVRDGSLVGTLDRSRFRMLVGSCSGSIKTVLGFVDFCTKQVHPLNIVDILHCNEGSIKLYDFDLTEEESKAGVATIAG